MVFYSEQQQQQKKINSCLLKLKTKGKSPLPYLGGLGAKDQDTVKEGSQTSQALLRTQEIESQKNRQ